MINNVQFIITREPGLWIGLLTHFYSFPKRALFFFWICAPVCRAFPVKSSSCTVQPQSLNVVIILGKKVITTWSRVSPGGKSWLLATEFAHSQLMWTAIININCDYSSQWISRHECILLILTSWLFSTAAAARQVKLHLIFLWRQNSAITNYAN